MQRQLTSGYSLWVLVSLSMAVLFFFLLVGVPLCTAQQFCGTTIFGFVLMGSLIMIILLATINHPSAKSVHNNNLVYTYLEGLLSLKTILLVPLGLVGVIFGSYVGVLMGQPILSIGLAGVMLAFTLAKSKTVIVPIIIHGFYNVIVILSQGAPADSFIYTLLATSPIVNQHLIGLSLGGASTLGSQVLFQFMIVAVAEEIYKIFLIDLVIVITRGKFDLKSSASTYAGFAIAVIVWTAYHTIDAVHVNV